VDEAELIRYAKDGDLEAFNRLVLAYQDMAFNLAYRMLSEAAAAEDVTQEAFLSAYRKLHTFRGGSFRAWLLRIVTNASYDELRRKGRRPTTALTPTDDEGEEVETPAWLADSSENPEHIAERVELVEAIQRCLQRLTPDFRAVVVMVDIQGLEYAEVAAAIRKPLGTVKSRLARARANMQDCLRGFKELLPSEFRLKSESV